MENACEIVIDLIKKVVAGRIEELPYGAMDKILTHTKTCSDCHAYFLKQF